MAELGKHAYLFTLTPRDLDPNLSDDPSGLYDATLEALAAAAGRLFQGPCWVVAEVGRGDYRTPGRGLLHTHVVGHRNDGLQDLERDTPRCRWIYDAFKLWRYLHKPPEAYNLEALLDYKAACVLSLAGHSPQTRRPFRSPERTAWARAQCTNDHSPPIPPVLACGRCRGRCCCRRPPAPVPLRTPAAAAAAAPRPRSRPPGRADHDIYRWEARKMAEVRAYMRTLRLSHTAKTL